MDADMDALIPDIFTCPLTLDAFDDPVVARDGHTYERAAIELHFTLRQTSPMSNERLESTQLLPNHTVRKAIEEWRDKQPLPVDPRRIHVTEEVLGQGSFCRVVAGTLNIGGGRVVRVAVKSMPDMTITEERDAFQRELKAHMHAVRHCDGICKLYGTYEWGNRLSLVMKLYEGGSLDKKIRDGTLDADKICRYTHALCSALRQLHGCGLLVRDIKPPNILFDSFDQPVLADFGIAEVVSTATRRLPTSIKGTFNYMAPETFLDAEAGGPGIGPPADIWAMACVVVEMHTRKVPWDGMNMQQIMRAVSLDYRAPAVPETAPAHALLARCFLRNPAHRPSAGDLADAFAPPSGARDMIAELCEEMDRLKAANTMLEARLKAAEAELAKERCERDTRERAREAELAEERCERDKEKARHAQVEQRIKASEEEEGCGLKLLKAAKSGDEATIRSLLSFINLTDEDLRTPLDLAVGLDVNARDRELEMRRKNVVVAFFDTIHNDVVREIDRSVQTKAFQKRLKVDRFKEKIYWFIESIKSESASRAEVYKAKPSAWFASNAHLGKAVMDGLALSTLAKAKYELWLRDKTLTLYHMGERGQYYHDYQRSYAKLLAQQREELTEAEEAAARQVDGSDGKAAIMVAGVMGEKADKLNGWYETTVDLQNGKPLFRKLKNPDAWLRFTRENTWMFSDTSDKDLNNANGWCVSVEAGKDLPTLVHSWKIEEEEEEAEIKCIDAAKRLQALALADCISRRFLAGEDELDVADESTSLTPLWQHLLLGDVKVAERLLQARASPEHVPSQDEERKTPLLWASKEGYADAALLLLKYKANTKATDKSGKTALMYASANGHEESVRTLIEKGASLEAVNEDGWTALMYASANGHEESMRTLIEKGASLEAVNEIGKTALMYASANGHEESMRTLIEKGASLEAVDKSGMTALMWASEGGHEESVRTLIEKGASLEAVNEEGKTALQLAQNPPRWLKRHKGHDEVVAVLTEQTASGGRK